MEESAANAVVLELMGRIAEWIRPHFPHHSSALRGEILGTKLTEERWHRVAAVIASLECIPGVPLTPYEHRVRNIALSSVGVAKKMASAKFGGRDPDGCRSFAVWYAGEISDMMSRAQNEQSNPTAP